MPEKLPPFPGGPQPIKRTPNVFERIKNYENADAVTWGEKVKSSDHHSMNYSCGHGFCPSSGKPEKLTEAERVRSLVGVGAAPWASELDSDNYDHAVLFCCPDCKSRYWNHTTRDNAARWVGLKKQQIADDLNNKNK